MAAPQRKPQADIYTVLLAVALFAILLGMIFLFLETKDYDGHKTSGRPMVRLDCGPAGATEPSALATLAWPTHGRNTNV